jgi:hypothetical protein
MELDLGECETVLGSYDANIRHFDEPMVAHETVARSVPPMPRAGYAAAAHRLHS